MKTNKKSLPKTLYYYCSLETFFNIINKRSIWLTEIGKSNDSMEQKYLASEIIYNLETYLKYRCIDTIDQARITNIQNEFYKKLSTHPSVPVWGICLSEKQDDLSQWRGYADDANGMCIGFSTRYLNTINELSKLQESPVLNDCLRFRKVEYGKEAITNYMNFLSDFTPLVSAEEIESQLSRDIEGIYVRPYHKHEAFKDEAEWRLIYTKITCEDDYKYNFEFLNQLLKQDNKFRLKEKFYEIRNGYLQSHIELEILDMLSAINVIYIGPKTKLTLEELEDFLSYQFGKNNLDEFPCLEYSSAFSYR